MALGAGAHSVTPAEPAPRCPLPPSQLEPTMSSRSEETYVLQGYLYVNRFAPHWCDLSFTAVRGWERYQSWSKGKLIRDPRLTPKFSSWAFPTLKNAHSVLRELLQEPQDMHLRVIRRRQSVSEVLVAGADIPDSTIVKQPDGSHPWSTRDGVADPSSLKMPSYLGLTVRHATPPRVQDQARELMQEAQLFIDGSGTQTAQEIAEAARDLCKTLVGPGAA